MPELPEVETMRRGVLPVEGATITDVVRLPCRLKPIHVKPRIDVFRRRVSNAVIDKVDRIGKRVVLRLNTGDSVILEPRMTGLVLLDDAPNTEHLRFRFDLDGAVAHLYFWDRRGLGSVRLLTEAEMAEQLGGDRLGPDALSITVEQLRERLKGSRRAVKVALLDQQVVAGIGNIYASEILHLARVHPEARCDLLSREQWRRIHERQLEVLQVAIDHEGSTLSDGAYRTALNDPGSYQNEHRVYDREGLACTCCEAGEIKRIVQAQRATFYCGRCQTKRDRKPQNG
jgi:formamidopyrimidine-DNA glycosylase